jgi:hypothetical protein
MHKPANDFLPGFVAAAVAQEPIGEQRFSLFESLRSAPRRRRTSSAAGQAPDDFIAAAEPG